MSSIEHNRAATRLAFALLLLIAPSAFSLEVTALTGHVRIADAAGSGVAVTIRSKALLGERSTVTGMQGTYWLEALPPGVYDVTFSKPGHTSITRRAFVELGRVARADARLEPSEDEESITSTASTLTVAETTAPTSAIDGDALGRLPVERSLAGAASLFNVSGFDWSALDSTPLPYVSAIGEEAVADVTITHSAADAGADRSRGGLFELKTRRGAEDRELTLRDSVSNGSRNLAEVAASGAVLPERLWGFVSVWYGDDAWRRVERLRGWAGTVTALAATMHQFELSSFDTDSSGTDGGMSLTAVRYSGMFGARTSLQGVASRSQRGDFHPGTTAGSKATNGSVRASHAWGAHVLSGGAIVSEDPLGDATGFFANDRWSNDSWIVNAGVRFEDDDGFDARVLPRLAVAYDLHGDGRQGLFASWGEYADITADEVHVASVGLAAAIGNTGSARVDAIRRELPRGTADELRASAIYRLFDRFEIGANYLYGDETAAASVIGDREHRATAWGGAQFPLGDHELGVTLLESYSGRTDAHWASLAVRYSLPLGSTRMTFASDATNLFDSEGADLPRALRFWVRLRM